METEFEEKVGWKRRNFSEMSDRLDGGRRPGTRS
jgi:hypothetical protein